MCLVSELCDMFAGSGIYQVVDGLAAESADQVDDQLEDEHHQDQGRHAGRGCCLW